MIQLTEQQLTELLHKATGNVKDFVCDNEGWISKNLPKGAINKNCISQNIRLSSLLEQKIATLDMINDCLEKPIGDLVRKDFEKEYLQTNAQIKLLRFILLN